MKFGMLPWSAGVIKLMLIFCHMINIQGRELYFGNFQETMFNIGLRLDAYESISFQLGMTVDMIKVDLLIPV